MIITDTDSVRVPVLWDDLYERISNGSFKST